MAAAGSASSSGPDGQIRVFSGDDEDAKEYKRWKIWITNKLLTLSDKVPASAKGAYVYTMLAGKALEAVEHLEPSSYQKENGEKVIFDLLDKRFPQKEATDELSENLTSIFGMKAADGEGLKAWISRASEAFDRLQRKTGVSFPDEARGWLILNRSGLSSEQQAVVLARSLGIVKREDIGRAMRSCYPEFTCRKKVQGAAAVTEESFMMEEDDTILGDEEDPQFADVELFLADHQPELTEAETFDEEEVREILAVTWQERRKTLNRLQKARRFPEANQVKRQFRVEVEELKKKTRCNKCNQMGHWARECRAPGNKGAGKGKNSSHKSSEAGAAIVEEFVAFVTSSRTMLQRLQDQRVMQTLKETTPQKDEGCTEEQLLVSSPGFGVLDSGCGGSIVGQSTYEEFVELWQAHGIPVPEVEEEVNHFRYGNGSRETSIRSVRMPVVLAGRKGSIRAAIVKGSAPLLVSRKALKALKAKIDFESSELTLFEDEKKVPLKTNTAGQFVVYLLGTEDRNEATFDEVLQTTCLRDEGLNDPSEEAEDHASDSPSSSQECPADAAEPNEAPSDSCPGADVSVWSRFDKGLKCTPIVGKQGPYWHQVYRRRVVDQLSGEVVLDQQIDHVKSKNAYHVELPDHVHETRTDFFFKPQETIRTTECLPVHQIRQLSSQVRKSGSLAGSFVDGKRLLVSEVFSPPRFAQAAKDEGFAARSYDLVNGFDFRSSVVRQRVRQELEDQPPDLLILCPPCTHEGGWWYWNSSQMSPAEVLRLRQQSRLYVRFCCTLFEDQIARGRMALFEHPLGSKIWSYPEVKRLVTQCHWIKCHMCRFGLKLPHSRHLIRKATGLLVSDSCMKELSLTCPGKHHHEHAQHDTVAGSSPGIGSVSQFAGQYTPAFVEAVLKTVPSFVRSRKAQEVAVSELEEHSVQECLANHQDALNSADDEAMQRALKKLHKNLGHPSNADLVRVLKHGHASERALRQFSCDFCKAQIKPHVPLPAQTSRATQFNQRVGIDVKYLPGWSVNQKIKALNIVDQSSCYQQMIPFFEQETSAVLARIFDESWVRWAGPPGEVIMDQAMTMLGETLQSQLEQKGAVVRFIAAEAHWQLGRTENHGGWFARVLQKVIDERSPQNRSEWEECVRHSHIKNTMIQSYGYTPCQHVFGRNPEIPGDLLSEPLHVIPSTAGLSDDALAKTQATRSAARRAVIEMQDNRAMRAALSARPRTVFNFQAGDLVAYWRQQKLEQGTIRQGGKWHGVAVVIGSVGRNLIIAHRKQIFRCAPEQLRPATEEEKVVISSPEVELLGIKDLIEGGTFRSKQYVDLVSSHYPPLQVEPPVHADSTLRETSAEVPIPSARETQLASPPEAEGHAMTESASGANPEVEVPPNVVSEEPRDDSTAEESSTYGPIRTRRRVGEKMGEAAMYRPPAMRESDFVELMRDLVPALIDEATQNPSSSSGTQGSKRERDAPNEEEPSEPPSTKPRTNEDEVMYIEELTAETWEQGIEAMVAAHIQKKQCKEIPPVGNDPELQALVDESKIAEWGTLGEKFAVKIHYGRKAAEIRRKFADRFIGSRFVIIRKAAEEGRSIDMHDPSSYKIKSRWCLQGHLDPDLEAKVKEGLLQSPTLSQMGRMVLMQMLASFKWTLQLGDIKGAFMEAGPLPDRFRPLFAKQPPGGIPGLPSDAVIEVVGNVYGQNDAPSAWYRTFDAEALEVGWTRSKLDPCLYTLRDQNNALCGIMGVHVDDTAIGGQGPLFESAVAKLKARFPYRKWRTSEGEFCGAYYRQDPASYEIRVSQQQFAEGLRAATLPRGVSNDTALNEGQIRLLRGINGSLNWLSSQSRPDLAVQTSLSQQCFPKPKVKHLRNANNAIRRAKQHKDLQITFRSVPPDKLGLCCHSDAAWANVGEHTQAGFIIAFVNQDVHKGKVTSWTPAVWRSYKLPRAVSSTLGGEAQAMATAGGTIEWLNLMLSEVLDGPFVPKDARTVLQRRPPVLATDCKSLYDHLISPSSPTSIDDRRTSIDVVIIRESLKVTGGSIRWLPTNRMLADGLTKDKLDPIDLLRACIRKGTYQISPEELVLEQQAEERARRREKNSAQVE